MDDDDMFLAVTKMIDSWPGPESVEATAERGLAAEDRAELVGLYGADLAATIERMVVAECQRVVADGNSPAE
jgi:hypothetical protein